MSNTTPEKMSTSWEWWSVILLGPAQHFYFSHQADITGMDNLEDKGCNKAAKVILVMLITLINTDRCIRQVTMMSSFPPSSNN